MGGKGSGYNRTPDTEHCRKLLAAMERAGRAYRQARVEAYELAEQALDAGITREDIARTTRLSRKTITNIARGRSQMDKPPEMRLQEWRERPDG